ncbi:MAG: hypothetical protein ACRDBQ_06505 [Shewanella sp.]
MRSDSSGRVASRDEALGHVDDGPTAHNDAVARQDGVDSSAG